jgi:serine/threonine protein kinase
VLESFRFAFFSNSLSFFPSRFEHNFEDAHFEHDRVDAVAMERLTSSKHVINIFGFCGHSVMTEYADGSRLGELVDKAKGKPLQRLRIARDIANGLADVHGIDGDGNATFVHLDINPANVVSVGGTLKLNDFNIGIIRRWNETSNEPCGFPAQYPNPQWRSPEEAREEQDLTEKVDVFSMGHIFFRMICGHEPWNKLEPGGRPSKEEVIEKVQTGILPFIPDSVMETDDPEVVAILEAMLGCYTFDPLQRPSARKISRSLDKVLQRLKKETISEKWR